MKHIIYGYITNSNTSFTITARQYITLFKRAGFKVYEQFNRSLVSWNYRDAPTVLPVIHPFFYAVLNLQRIPYSVYSSTAIDVCESEEMGPVALQYIKIPRFYIVPSKKCVEVYAKYIPRNNVFYLPHMLEEEYLHDVYKNATSEVLKTLYEKKKQTDEIYIGYIVKHSWWRKGADVLIKFYRFIKATWPNSKLIIITSQSEREIITKLAQGIQDIIILVGDYTKADLSLFYKIVDIYPATSRGGAFEIPFLEAVWHGAIVPHVAEAPWAEYLPSAFAISKYHRSTVHAIHSLAWQLYGGPGWEPDSFELYEKVVSLGLKEGKQISESHKQFLLDYYTIDGNITRARELLNSIFSRYTWIQAK